MNVLIRTETDYFSDEEYDLPPTVRVAVLGPEGIGKTSFIHAYLFDKLPQSDFVAPDDHTYSKSDTIGRNQLTVTLTEFHLENPLLNDTFDWSDLEVVIQQFDCFVIMVSVSDPNHTQIADGFLSRLMGYIKEPKPMSILVLANMSDLPVNSTAERKFLEMKVDYSEDEYYMWRNLRSSFMFGSLLDMSDCCASKGMATVLDDWKRQYFRQQHWEVMREYRKEVDKDAMLDTCLSGEGTIIYDMLTIFVSLADIITDLWVLIQWYNQGRMTPFYISLTILILAQLSYIGAFSIRYCLYSDWHTSCNNCPNYFALLPFLILFSPLLSFVIYFSSVKDSYLGKLMDEHGFIVDQIPDSDIHTKITKLLYDKIYKHMGFLLEAAVEAFPQSILQMAVMVYYSETNWISVASILLSLISVCTKSLVFSYALELRTMIFNYLSIVLDFISVFALITWVFYNPNQSGLTTLGWIWVYKVLFTTVAGVYIGGFIYSTFWIIRSAHDSYIRLGHWSLCRTLTPFCVFYTLWLIFSPFVALMMELGCCSGLALALFQYYSARFSDEYCDSLFWSQTLSFVNDGPTWDDRKLRVILVMESIAINIQGNQRDNTLIQRISESRQCMYNDIKWKDIRNHLDKPSDATPLSQLLNEQSILCSEKIMNGFIPNTNATLIQQCSDALQSVALIIAIYGLLPIHICTRLFNFIFVWIAFILNVQSHFHEMDHLQLGMSLLLFILQICWILALSSFIQFHYPTWHIYPGQFLYFGMREPEEAYAKFKRIKDLHQAWIIEPERKKAVMDHFGQDVGSVLLEFLPTRLVDMGTDVKSNEQ